jgi:hypothetical protein
VPQRSSLQLARAVGNGREVSEALRHLDTHRSEIGAIVLADALARFLVGRCESHHAGWRTVRRVVVESAADAPWEKCARRAVTQVTHDLLNITSKSSRTRLGPAQHLAAKRRAEQIARHVDGPTILADLGLDARAVSAERWQAALGSAVTARSRQQVARALDRALCD